MRSILTLSMMLVLLINFSFSQNCSNQYGTVMKGGNGPEIYVNVTDFPPNSFPHYKVRIRMDTEYNYWHRTGVYPNFTYTLQQNNDYNQFPYASISERDDNEYLIIDDGYIRKQYPYIGKFWWGFESNTEDGSPCMDNYGFGIYRISALYKNPAGEDQELTHFYFDIRDEKLVGNYTWYDIHFVYYMPEFDDDGFPIDEGVFNIYFLDGQNYLPETDYVTVSKGSTLGIWTFFSLKFDPRTSPEVENLTIDGDPYTELEVPQNVSINAPANQNPTINWDDVNNVNDVYSYNIYRSDGNGPYFKTGTSTTNSFTDTEVIRRKFTGMETFKYKITTIIRDFENSSNPGYETIKSSYVSTYGYLENTTKSIASINDQSSLTVEKFKLYDIYPNPFNPTAIIKYNLLVESNVNLEVYNINGENIATLVDNIQQKGRYSVKFDGTKLPAGTYFYRIEAGSYKATKKMILIK